MIASSGKVSTNNWLFLDIDGVLNSERTVHAHQRLIHAGRVKQDILLGKGFNPLWDPIAIGMLKMSQEPINFKIVISSTWRILFSLEDFHTVFAFYGWNTRGIVVGKTDQEPASRGIQIQRWLQSNANPQDKYCIMDDDNDMLATQQPNFVNVSYEEGLTYNDIRKMHNVFGVKLREF